MAIIFTVIILIALLRFGVIVEYSDAGLTVRAKVGFTSFVVYPKKEKPGSAEKKATLKALKEKKKKEKEEKKLKEKKPEQEKPEEKKPGGLGSFLDILRAVKNTLSRLKRKLLIKQLILHYTSAGDDPAKTALIFGAANAVFGMIVPVLERNFRIKRSDLSASADFSSGGQAVYAKIIITIAVWEVIYVSLALLPLLKAKEKRHNGKELVKNG